MCGMAINALVGYKDVQINPNKRGSLMKDFPTEHRPGVAERFTMFKGGVRPEGLGIDHEEWLRKKEEYMKK